MNEYAKPDPIDEAIERRKASVLLLEERLEFEQIRLLLLQRARERGILLKAIGWNNQTEPEHVPASEASFTESRDRR